MVNEEVNYGEVFDSYTNNDEKVKPLEIYSKDDVSLLRHLILNIKKKIIKLSY